MKNRYLALAALVAGLTACGGSQTLDATADSATETVTAAAEEAVDEVVDTMMLRVINAASDTASVTVGVTAMDASAPGTFNQTRVETLAGEMQIGGTVGVIGLGDMVDFAAGGNYTVVLMGDATSANATTAPRGVAFVDNMTGPPEGASFVRFIHAGYGMDNVAVTIDGAGVTADVAYGSASEFHAGPGTSAEVVISVSGQEIASHSIPFVEGRLFTIVGVPAEEGSMNIYVVNEAPAGPSTK